MFLFEIKSIDSLCARLACTRKGLFDLIRNRQYDSFTIPKKKGGFRLIESPEPTLKKLQNRIAFHLNFSYAAYRPDCVHGFVRYIKSVKTTKNIGIISNAKNHVGKKYVWNIDISDFFHSISITMLADMFLAPPFNMESTCAELLAMICTYKKRLAVGSPCSPVLSNFVFLKTDNKLLEIAQNNELTYTRYADDLTFSSDQIITPKIMQEIFDTLEHDNFEINQSKNRLSPNTKRQTVTGIKVNEKLNLDSKFKRKLRAIQHDIRCNGIQQAAMKFYKMDVMLNEEQTRKFLLKIEGYQSFLKMIDHGTNP